MSSECSESAENYPKLDLLEEYEEIGQNVDDPQETCFIKDPCEEDPRNEDPQSRIRNHSCNLRMDMPKYEQVIDICQ
jgi:hypothetical protein